MNASKHLALLLSAILLILCIAGCSAKSSDSYVGNGSAAAPEDGIYDSLTGTSSSVSTQHKLIRRISLETETEDMDRLLSQIDSKVAELEGYIESRNVRSGSPRATYTQYRYATLTIRIPADRLDGFISHVDDVSNVTASNESTEDVTLEYVAIESRMKALKAEEERLLALIDEAADLSELLQLESRLTDIRTELEKVTSQLLVYDNLVAYGTVTVQISEVKTLTPTEEPGFWSRIASGLRKNTQGLVHFLKETAIFLITSLPYLLPLAAIVVAVVLIIKRTTRKKKAPKDSDPTT